MTTDALPGRYIRPGDNCPTCDGTGRGAYVGSGHEPCEDCIGTGVGAVHRAIRSLRRQVDALEGER